MHQDQVDAVTQINLKDSAEDVKTQAAVLKTRMVLFNLFYDLPNQIQLQQEVIEQSGKAKEKFKASQESGDLVAKGGVN